jgi:hypothetical protein
MYHQYKQKLASKGYRKWNNYSLELDENIVNKFNQFIPTNEYEIIYIIFIGQEITNPLG